MKKFILILTLFLYIYSYSQTKEQRHVISNSYDIKKLNELSIQYSNSYSTKREKALQLAQIKNWKIKYDENGISYELREVTEDGYPLYYTTHNIDAARSTRTDHLNNGGSLGLNLEGQNMIIHVWDNGHALSTHQEFDGIGGENRHSKGDTWAGITPHNTHIMGTLIASGVNENAKGMAPQARGISYHWVLDIPKMVDIAESGMLVSNHSYGDNTNSIPDNMFGAYSGRAQKCDNIMRNTPYYLLVTSAGNAGLDHTCNSEPINGNSQYDKLTDFATCKNGLTVANAIDAEVTTDGTLINVLINGNSSQGPTDDFRIKPDITGNGTSVYSSIDTNDNSYDYYSGTSMSSPNVAGSLLLLQQHYNNINGYFMKAATLKGLALHTADDIGMSGPDAVSGWGLLNAKVAAQTISNIGLESLIIEENISFGETYTITVQSDNTNPLLTSISWTDLAGPEDYYSGSANNPTPKLRNDLDLRVYNDVMFEPWKLIDVDANAKGDNYVDPYERVDITDANGIYTINISNKQILNNRQDFSLIVTGITSHFLTLNAINSFVETCQDNSAIFNFSYLPQTGANANDTSFTAQNIPEGAQATFTNTEDQVQMKIDNLQNVTANEYIIDVTAENNGQSITKQVSLLVNNSSLTKPKLLHPTNFTIFDSEKHILLEWTEVDVFDPKYYLEVSTDPIFDDVFFSDIISNSTQYPFLASECTTYYWRVRGENQCNVSTFSSVYQFTVTPCTFFIANADAIVIPSVDSSEGLIVNYYCPKEFYTDDIALNLKMSHNEIGSLWVTLTSPKGTIIDIIKPNLECETENVISSFRDKSMNEILCIQTENNYSSNNLKPIGSFENISNEYTSGFWKLKIKNTESDYTGLLEEWGIVFCGDKYLSNDKYLLHIWPNPTDNVVNFSLVSEMDQKIILKVYDISGRFIQQFIYDNNIFSFFQESVNLSHLTSGFYTLQLINGNTNLSAKLMIK